MAELLEADRSILVILADWCERQSRLERYEFARPMDIGGRGGSGHAQALGRLLKLGLVERRQRTDVGQYILIRSRASWEYRITPEGKRQAESGRPPGAPTNSFTLTYP